MSIYPQEMIDRRALLPSSYSLANQAEAEQVVTHIENLMTQNGLDPTDERVRWAFMGAVVIASQLDDDARDRLPVQLAWAWVDPQAEGTP